MGDLITIPTNNVPLPPQGFEDDLSGFGNIKEKAAYLTLVQPSTRDPKTARPGEFLDQETGEVFQTITLVPLGVKPNRTLFPPGMNLDDEPVCKSDDCIVPSKFAAHPQARTCRECSFSKWGPSNERPQCRESRLFTFAALDADYEVTTVYHFKLSASSFPNIESLQRVLTKDRQAQAKDGVERGYYDYIVQMGTARGKKGTSFLATFSPNIQRVNEIGKFRYLFDEWIVKRRSGEAQEQSEQVVNNAVGEITDVEVITEV
jgi:hypothetical protein